MVSDTEQNGNDVEAIDSDASSLVSDDFEAADIGEDEPNDDDDFDYEEVSKHLLKIIGEQQKSLAREPAWTLPPALEGLSNGGLMSLNGIGAVNNVNQRTITRSTEIANGSYTFSETVTTTTCTTIVLGDGPRTRRSALRELPITSTPTRASRSKLPSRVSLPPTTESSSRDSVSQPPAVVPAKTPRKRVGRPTSTPSASTSRSARKTAVKTKSKSSEKDGDENSSAAVPFKTPKKNRPPTAMPIETIKRSPQPEDSNEWNSERLRPKTPKKVEGEPSSNTDSSRFPGRNSLSSDDNKMNEQFQQLQLEHNNMPDEEESVIIVDVKTEPIEISDEEDAALQSPPPIVPKTEPLNFSGKENASNVNRSSRKVNRKRTPPKSKVRSKSSIKLKGRPIIQSSPPNVVRQASSSSTPVRQSDSMPQFVEIKTPRSGIITRKNCALPTLDIERPENWSLKVNPSATVLYVGGKKGEMKTEPMNNGKKMDFLNHMARSGDFFAVTKDWSCVSICLQIIYFFHRFSRI